MRKLGIDEIYETVRTEMLKLCPDEEMLDFIISVRNEWSLEESLKRANYYLNKIKEGQEFAAIVLPSMTEIKRIMEKTGEEKKTCSSG